MLGFILLLTAVSLAAPRATRDPLPNREVERSVVLPKGWTEVQLRGDHQPDEVGWRQHALDLRARIGLLPRLELRGRIGGGLLDREAGTTQPRFGARQLLHVARAPARSVAVDAWFEAPSLGPVDLGVWMLGLGTVARQQLGGLLLEGGVHVIQPFPRKVSWQAEPLRLSTGVDGRGMVLLQMAFLAVGVEGHALELPDPDGIVGARRVDVDGRVLLQPTRGVDLGLRLGQTVVGTSDADAPSRLQPRPGWRIRWEVGTRW